MSQTKNFSIDTDPKLRCTCGSPHCDKRVVKQDVLNMIQKIRDDLGQSMTITSGGRCPFHLMEMGRGPGTDHQLCTTVDIKCNSPEHETKLKVLAGRYGATRVAGSFEDGFVHMSWTPTDRKDVPTWSYNG